MSYAVDGVGAIRWPARAATKDRINVDAPESIGVQIRDLEAFA
jgi:hypothetical protein